MAEVVMGAALQVLLERLLTAVYVEEISPVFGVKKEMEKLQNSLTTVQSSLNDASRRNVENKAVKLWLKKLEDVAYEADHLLDKFNYEKMRREKRKACFSFLYNNRLTFRLKMAHKMKDVNMKFETVIHDAATIRVLQEIVADSAIYLPPVNETDSISDDPIFLGRDDVVSNIVNVLVDPNNKEIVSVLPISGMGGLGKTTLARSVFWDPRIVAHFKERIWVCVSDKFDTKGLLKKILEALTKDVVQLKEKETILNTLLEKLKVGRYLLVLDDLWNNQRSAWEDFKRALLGINSNEGNFCLVTTRSADVSSIVNTTSNAHPLDKLSDDVCWSIIKARAFARMEVPKEMEIIGEKIASRCRGVPLAANMVGAPLTGKGIDEPHFNKLDFWMPMEKKVKCYKY